jgi:cytochrome c oxidase subunit 2
VTTRAGASIVFATAAVLFEVALACRASHEEHAAAGSASVSNAQVSASDPTEHVVQITAKRFEYSPATITVKKGEPVVLELVSLDRVHGFDLPDFKLRTDVKPEQSVRLRFVPDKAGRFEFHCDVFCGAGHEDMTGELVVEE